MPGGEGLTTSSTPWVFVAEGERFQLAGVGDLRLPDAMAIVAMAEGSVLESLEGSTSSCRAAWAASLRRGEPELACLRCSDFGYQGSGHAHFQVSGSLVLGENVLDIRQTLAYFSVMVNRIRQRSMGLVRLHLVRSGEQEPDRSACCGPVGYRSTTVSVLVVSAFYWFPAPQTFPIGHVSRMPVLSSQAGGLGFCCRIGQSRGGGTEDCERSFLSTGRI